MRKTHLESHQLLESKKILIFGSNSSLAKELLKINNKQKYLWIKISRKHLDFNSNYKSSKLIKLLDKIQPSIIINLIGKFDTNRNADKSLLISNILPTWEIIKYFQKKKIKKKINILILGSSSYKSPRKNYMLYAASKAGLNSLCKSAKEFFSFSNITIKIFNPSTFGGKHLGKYAKKSNIDINLVAKKVYRYINKVSKK